MLLGRCSLAAVQSSADNGHDAVLSVRATLAAVCRAWNIWVSQSLYRDITVPTTSRRAQILRDSLERTYGAVVRRVVLPYSSTVPGPLGSPHAIEILRSCSNLHTLHRPYHPLSDHLPFEFDVQALSFPSLQRLEWWHHSEAERSGGINSLASVLHSTPRLRYLFVGGVVGSHHQIGAATASVSLPELTTLRLHIRNGLLMRQIAVRWYMPALTHVILDLPISLEGADELWRAVGAQLELIELGKHVRFLMTDYLSPCLESCPNLKQLNYYLFFTTPPQTTLCHTALTLVRLHPDVNQMIADGNSIWNLIQLHFKILCDHPALQEIVLHGNYSPILNHPRFAAVKSLMQSRNKILKVWNQPP